MMKMRRSDLNKIGGARVRAGQWVMTKVIYQSVADGRYFIHVDNDYREVVFDDGIYVIK